MVMAWPEVAYPTGILIIMLPPEGKSADKCWQQWREVVKENGKKVHVVSLRTNHSLSRQNECGYNSEVEGTLEESDSDPILWQSQHQEKCSIKGSRQHGEEDSIPGRVFNKV